MTVVSDEVCGYFRDLGQLRLSAALSGDRRRPRHRRRHPRAIFSSSRLPTSNGCATSSTDWAETLGVEKTQDSPQEGRGVLHASFITRYIVEQAIGGVLRDRFEQTARPRTERPPKGRGQSGRWPDPGVYELDKLTKPAKSRAGTLLGRMAGRADHDSRSRPGPAAAERFSFRPSISCTPRIKRSNDRLAELRGPSDTLRSRQADSRKQSVRPSDLKRKKEAIENLPAQPVDQNGAARQGPHEPRPSDPRRQQRRSPTRLFIPGALELANGVSPKSSCRGDSTVCGRESTVCSSGSG